MLALLSTKRVFCVNIFVKGISGNASDLVNIKTSHPMVVTFVFFFLPFHYWRWFFLHSWNISLFLVNGLTLTSIYIWSRNLSLRHKNETFQKIQHFNNIETFQISKEEIHINFIFLILHISHILKSGVYNKLNLQKQIKSNKGKNSFQNI